MHWDDKYDDEYESEVTDAEAGHHEDAEGLDPLDIDDPESAYYFLSDDAQDEIEGRKRVKMRCRLCGHQFMGDDLKECPLCLSSDVEEIDGVA